VRKYVGKPARISPLSLDSLNIKSSSKKGVDSKYSSRDAVSVKKVAKKTVKEQEEYVDDFEEERNEYPVQRHRPARLREEVQVEPKQTRRQSQVRQKSSRAESSGFEQEEDQEFPVVEQKQSKRKPMESKAARQAEPVIQYEESEEDQEDVAVKKAPSQYSNQGEDPEEFVVHAQLFPCSICSRSFADELRLEKHQRACKKSTKPRKVFDMKKARVQGTELEKYATPKKVCSLYSYLIGCCLSTRNTNKEKVKLASKTRRIPANGA
jgi:hypothetical protein